MNILVHAFFINPSRGSEFSVSWNYVLQMAKKHNLYVLVMSSDDVPGVYDGLEALKLPNVEFILPKLGKIYTRAKARAKRTWPYTRYVAYHFWNRHVYHMLKKDSDLLSKIDLIHFLSPVGWHEIGYLYKLGKPCIWGPVGGFTNCRKDFYSHYVKTKGRKIALKNFSNAFSALTSRHVRQAMKSYDLVIANTTDTLRFIEKHYKTKQLVYFPENSMRITEDEIKSEGALSEKYGALRGKKIKCVWCGSLDERKMPLMLLDIVSQMKHKNKLYINIVGGGYLQQMISERIVREGLSDVVSLCGQLPRDEVRSHFTSAHLHLLTSSYEANTTVMFEAMEECVPSFVFDHFGMADLVKDGKTGRKIPVSDYGTMCRSFATALDEICEKPELLGEWAKNLREESKQYTAEKRADFFEKCYAMALKDRGEKRI